jgi:hypothetical protein
VVAAPIARHKPNQKSRCALLDRFNHAGLDASAHLAATGPTGAGIQKRVMETYKPDRGWCDFYGRYPRKLRINIDQVCHAIT